jgi:bacterioferritin
MKGNSEVVQHLNQQLANEQSAVNQYLLHSQQLKDWGIAKMAETERKEALEEVEHAELLIERIKLGPDASRPLKTIVRAGYCWYPDVNQL